MASAAAIPSIMDRASMLSAQCLAALLHFVAEDGSLPDPQVGSQLMTSQSHGSNIRGADLMHFSGQQNHRP